MSKHNGSLSGFATCNLSNRTGDGGIHPPGPHPRDAILPRDPNSVAAVSSLRPVNSRAQLREPFIDDRELLAGLLFFLVPLLAGLIVLVSALVYSALRL